MLGSWFGVSLACAGGVGSFLVVMVVILGGDVYPAVPFVFLGADGVGREREEVSRPAAGGDWVGMLITGCAGSRGFDPGVE